MALHAIGLACSVIVLNGCGSTLIMTLIVQKFGGTSVADAEKILSAARKAVRAHQQGHQVVMVVSAMGKNTDMLVDLASQLNQRPPAREMDMLLSTGEQVSVALMAMAIDSLGHKAVSLTGAQIGIRTDSTHTKARIISISTDRMQSLLNEGQIVIAAGFQGIDEEFNITTLGRGGSDTTAVALAAVLGADTCEIYTDVDGVYTTDPRKVAEARRVSQISYDEMLELASLGAGVMHSRSIEFAKKFSVPIHVRGSFTDLPGTMIVAEPEVADRPVGGAAVTLDEARVAVSGVPDVPGSSWHIFSRITDQNISVDMIVQNVGDNEKADIAFTVPRNELEMTLEATREAAAELQAIDVTYDENVSKVSVVGVGMAQQTGVADQMFGALANAGISMQMITTSEIKISALVSRDEALSALREIHRVFELDVEPDDKNRGHSIRSGMIGDAVDVVERLRGVGMEELTIDDIVLDKSQARVTIANIPDVPGVAAHVFDEVAAADIFVDMIVQSYGYDGKATLSFTVLKDKLTESLEVANRLTKELEYGVASSSPDVAKLSVSGIGLRSHTGVAIRMFKSLADAGINVNMINTSEVRVNIVVDGSQGDLALVCLNQAFADVLR